MTKYCECCEGQGIEVVDRKNMSSYLYHMWNEHFVTKRNLIRIWHEWKKDKEAPCRCCNGRGSWDIN